MNRYEAWKLRNSEPAPARPPEPEPVRLPFAADARALSVCGPLVRSDAWILGRVAAAAACREMKRPRAVSFEYLWDAALPLLRYRSRAALWRIVWQAFRLHDRRVRSGAWQRSWSADQSRRARCGTLPGLLRLEPRDRCFVAWQAAGAKPAACAQRWTAETGEPCSASTARGAAGRLARLRVLLARKTGLDVRPNDTAHKLLVRIGYGVVADADAATRANPGELADRVKHAVRGWRAWPLTADSGWWLRISAALKAAVWLWCQRQPRERWPVGYGFGLAGARQMRL